MKTQTRCLYAVLELEPDASENDIKKAFRKAALVWHPDKHGDKSGSELELVSENDRDQHLLIDRDFFFFVKGEPTISGSARGLASVE
jgi:hypothetical protein